MPVRHDTGGVPKRTVRMYCHGSVYDDSMRGSPAFSQDFEDASPHPAGLPVARSPDRVVKSARRTGEVIMAKRKNKKQRQDADAQSIVRKGITGGAVAGAATYLAGKVVETVVDKAVSAGCERIWGDRRGGGAGLSPSPSCASAAQDLGLEILKTLAGRVEPLPVFRLAAVLR